MSTDVALFLLRLLSALLLLGILAALGYLLWRDHRSAAREVESTRRSHGRLVVMQEVDGTYARTGETYPLLPLTSLGRSPTNTVQVDDTFASGAHAVVTMRNGQWWLEDRHSRNGTMLNGIPINQPVVVTDGDVIGIGQCRYRLEIET